MAIPNKGKPLLRQLIVRNTLKLADEAFIVKRSFHNAPKPVEGKITGSQSSNPPIS